MSIKLTVIILTYNEEIHIERCIRSLVSVASKILIIDSFSTDRTVEIARSLGAVVVRRKWKNYADQFQWGLDKCAKDSGWIMRMDADEYFEVGLQKELLNLLPIIESDIDGIYIRRKVIFYGKWIRHGGYYPIVLLRIWRNGKGRIEQRWMDEHIVLPPDTKTITVKEHLVDDNLKGVTSWVSKHNSYASREMLDLMNIKYGLFKKDQSLTQVINSQAKWKRLLKNKVYSRLPIGFRAGAYFCYRYIFRLGFLDGTQGFLCHFMQGFWYRLLVDIKIMEIEKSCAGNVEKIKKVLREEHGINL